MLRMGLVLFISTISLLIISGCQDNASTSSEDNSSKSLLVLDSGLGGWVWDDQNANGIQDEGEPGVVDIAVSLYTCDDTLAGTTSTDTNGVYSFAELDSGDYYLMFELPENYMFTLYNEGEDDAIDSDVDPATGMTECFTLLEDDTLVSFDAGIYMTQDDGCTYGKGYWKNHCGFGPQDDLVTDLLPIWLGNDEGEYSLAIDSARIAYDILGQHQYGHPSNGITKLYAHLLTAKLNIANGASDDDIADTITEIDNFLADHDWQSWDDLDHEMKQMVNQWKGMLGDYNDGEIGPGSCDDPNMRLEVY